MVPDYQSLMLPLLKLSADQQEHRIGHIIEKLGTHLGLTEADLGEMIPSGRQSIFSNRAHWAKTYLAQAGLLEITRRAHFKITARGLKVLSDNPPKIDIKLLEQFPEFKDFRNRGSDAERTEATTLLGELLALGPQHTPQPRTPDEALREIMTLLESSLAGELLSRILAAPPAFFESLIVKLLLEMGYGGSREDAGRAIGKSGDGGIDGVIDQDRLGLDRVYLQAKRYKTDSPVSEPEVRAFSGSLGAHKADKGVFVTTSYFTQPAHEFAKKHPFKMVLIDGAQLCTLMIRHNVGVRLIETHEVKKLDEEFFGDE